MEKVPNTLDKFFCEKDETVTFTFVPVDTTFLVTRKFIIPASGPDVDKPNQRLVFVFKGTTRVLIDYGFNAPGGGSRYNVTIIGSNGGSFTNRINQPISLPVLDRLYGFFVKPA